MDSPGGPRPLHLDLRSLALMRIAVAGLVLLDLLWRSRDLVEYYTDRGVAPRALITTEYWNPAWWSIHLFHGEAGGQACLFGLHGLAALALLVGWRTRIASWVTFLLMVSLHNRNPLIIDGGDRLLLIILFWGLFLPWEARFSWDARGSDKRDHHVATTPGGSGYLLQVVTLYLMAAYWKLHPVWFSDRSALYRTLELDQFTKPLGRTLLNFPSLLAFLTLTVFLIEWLAPMLMLTGNNRARTVGVASLLLFHLGIALCMDLEFFPLVSMAALLGCLPTHLWRDERASEGAASVPKWSVGPAAHIGVTTALVLILLWNGLVIVNDRKPPPHDSPVAMALSVFRLTQFWDLFSPIPRPVDSRYFVEAELQNGDRIDLLREGQPLSSATIKYPYQEFKNQRQRIYLAALEWSVQGELRRRYLQRRIEEWEQKHPQQTILWARLWSVQRQTRYLDPFRRPRLVELARTVNPEADWKGPVPPGPGPHLK